MLILEAALESKKGFELFFNIVFIVYLASHSRPMVESLNPESGNLRPVFEREFQGMVVVTGYSRGTEDCRGNNWYPDFTRK